MFPEGNRAWWLGDIRMSLKKKIGIRLSRIRFVREAIESRADLSAFREKPTPRVYLGIFLMFFSYLIGWPAVSLFAILAVHLRQPLIVAIGGPLIYGISHLTFIAGAYLSGEKYAAPFLKWAARTGVEKLIGEENDERR